ncbi:uncharacterized protein V1516DRAFT_82759 [Lipomyces oligophaga]|uniref:uncharacterized protein n=1 Tax=Lipomyces oligophaga TaxID=45792 RepID=UPI0034CECAE2
MSSLDDLPIEVLQTIALDLSDRCLCSLIYASKRILAKLGPANRYFWRIRFRDVFDPPVFLDGRGFAVTDETELSKRDAQYDYFAIYAARRRVLLKRLPELDDNHDDNENESEDELVAGDRPVTRQDMQVIAGMLADHYTHNYELIKESGISREFLFHEPMDSKLASDEQALELFWLVKTALISAEGFPGIAPSPLDLIYRVVYDSPRHPLFDENGVPQLHVIGALVTFWQMMNVQSGVRRLQKGLDPIEIFRTIKNPLLQGQADVAGIDATESERQRNRRNDHIDSDGDSDDANNVDEMDDQGPGQILLSAYAFFNYWDFELFRSAPLSNETRRSIIGDIVYWKLDLPENIVGPVGLHSTGTSHQLTGITERRRSLVEITPIEEAIMGIRGWARFEMRRLEFEVEEEFFEEQRWIHQAIILPGSKAILGRWHDGFDEDTSRSVEGPLIWIRE